MNFIFDNKKATLIISIAALAISLYLLFAQIFCGANTSSKKKIVANNEQPSAFRIAFFNMDSVEAKFHNVAQVKKALSKKQDDISVELDRLGKNYMAKYSDLQNKAKSGSLSQEESDRMSNELMQMQQSINDRKQKAEMDFQSLLMQSNTEIRNKISSYLKEYNSDNRYAYIVSNEAGVFFYSNPVYDITDEVINGLNEKYKDSK